MKAGLLYYAVRRAFIPPGELLEIEVKLTGVEGNTANISVESRRNKRPVGAARVMLVAT